MKYKDWLGDWLNDYVKPSVKMRTFERYSLIMRIHIMPDIGRFEMEELTLIILQKYVTELLQGGNKRTGAGMAPNSVNTIISLIQSSLRTAHMLGLMPTYFADKIKRPRITERKVDSFTLVEQKKIESYIINSKNDKLLGIVLCLYSGLRIGELLALTWSDLDFRKGVLTVSKSCYDGKDGIITDEPKTASSRRVIPIPKQIVPLLKALKVRSHSQFVVSSDGKQIAARSYQRSFELLQKRLKIPRRGFHSLRHTFATRALECGMDVKTLAEILGHKDATVTLNRYAHSLLEHKRSMMNRLGKLL